MTRRRLSSTYRLQVQPSFDLDAAAGVADHLDRLGVSHVYTSPLLAAEPGSAHGYDVVDPTVVDPDRGGEEGFARLVARLDELDLGLVVDIVPNHVAVLTAANPSWWDVLRRGPDSPAADRFDIDWADHDGLARVVVPVLGDHLDAVIDEIEVRVEDGEPRFAYHEHRFPVRPGSLEEQGVDPADGTPDRDVLRALLDRQHHDLRYWRDAVTDLNYRRFFDVTSLGGVRIEDPEVADWVLGRSLRMVTDGHVDGLRVDHPDGMRDPAGAFARMRRDAPDAWLVIEKILEDDEPVRSGWPVDGDVGYGFARRVLGLLVDPAAEPALTRLAAEAAGQHDTHEQIVRRSKAEVVDTVLVAEHRMLARLLVAAGAHAEQPVDEDTARRVLREVLVDMDVYRTYVVPERDEVSDEDRAAVARAVGRAHDHLDARDHAALELLQEVLVLHRRGTAGDELAARFQQVSGPVMAKGVEDTTFYRDVRFVALNEVGGSPAHVGEPPSALHAANQQRQARWPKAMLTTSTHDTKRSEDVRTRLAVLSEVADEWATAVRDLAEAGAHLRGAHGPSPAAEHLAWQTLVGVWPIDGDRLVAYLRKATREAKQDTSWLDPDEAFEADLEDWARGVVREPAVLDRLEALLRVVRPAGRVNSLTMTLLRLTSPGVPDTYQGCELWDLSLVDPDNRRPVDWDLRRRLLDRCLDGDVDTTDLTASLLDADDAGIAKLWVVHRALHLRRERDLTSVGYRPLEAQGDRADHVVAYLRGPDVLVVVPRLTVALGPVGAFDWQDTTVDVPAGSWTDRLTGRRHDGGARHLDELLSGFPVALLVRDDGSET